MKFFATAVLCLLFLSPVARGQSLSLFDVDASGFPIVKGKLYAFDAAGSQVRPGIPDVGITENGIQRTVLSVTCPPQQPPRPLSSVLVIDVSKSMEQGPSGTRNLDLAQAAGRAWVNALPLGESECAVTSFDHLNYLNQDFTTDRQALLDALTGLRPNGMTDYDQGLLLPVAGGLEVSKKGKHQRVVVFLTDGLPNQEPNVAAIVAEAQRQNCIIFAVTLNMQCPSSLREISTETGGNWFENVTSVGEAEEIYQQILREARSGTPCEITWQSEACPAGYREIELRWNGLTAMQPYVVPAGAAMTLDFDPVSIFFRAKPLGVAHDTTITVTARNAGFAVSNVRSSNPAYEIVPSSFTLAEGESRTLTVRYTPSDSGYTWTEFLFETDVCTQYYYASGGFPGVAPKNPSLRLTHPNGGEIFLVGSDTIITWTGIPATDWVKLEYSTNNGTNWITVEPRTRGGRYAWKVPATPSNQCLARVTRLDETEADETGLLHVLPGHTSDVHPILWSPDGTRLITASFDQTLKMWDAASGAIIRTFTGHAGGIYDVKWSPDGTKLASGDVTGTLIIWDAASGSEIQRISAHSLPILSLNWSPDGTRVVTAGADRVARIWNASNGVLLHTLTGFLQEVFDVKWSPDGARVAVSGFDGTARVYDAATGAETALLVGHTARINRLEWSPDGTRIATSSRDSTAKIFDAATGNEILSLRDPVKSHNGYVFWAEWSPDGTKVATAGRDEAVKIWDASSGALLRNLSGHTDAVNMASWSPDGSLILSSGFDNTTRIWNPSTGGILQVLTGHGGTVYNSDWSPDGTRIATSSADRTGRIWYVRQTPVQEDISDAVFSIVAPAATAIDVDMGKVQVGSRKDSVVAAFITNPGTYPMRIDSISIDAGNLTPFALVSGVPPVVIPPGGSVPVEFGFAPVFTGTFTVPMTIHAGALRLDQSITGVGVAPEIEVIGNVIDFGAVDVGQRKDTLRAVTIRNVGSAPVTITATRHAGPNDVDFTTLAGGGPFTLVPGETAVVDLRFAPSDSGRTTGRLLFDYDGPASPATVLLYGEGLMNPARAFIRIADAEAMAGDTVEIPVLLVSASNVEGMPTTGYTAQLRFNATLLEPIGPTPAGTLNGDDRVIDLSLPAEADAEGVLTRLLFRAGLGTDSLTGLLLENSAAIGGTVSVLAESGEFRLLGICMQGGARLVNPNGSVTLKLVSANPVREGIAAIELETIEIGRTMLELTDASGNEATRFIDGAIEPGRRILLLDLTGIPSGGYFLTLRTPTEQRTIRVEVAR